MVSELIFETPDGKEIGRINATTTPILNVRLTNSTVGNRDFTIQVLYEWNKRLQAKDSDKPKGVILK
jgi:hypothetical protein